MKDYIPELLEKLSELEHEQWIYWTKELEKQHRTDPAWQYQLEQWRKSWIPYSQLNEGQKEMDRIHARKVIEVMQEMTDKIMRNDVIDVTCIKCGETVTKMQKELYDQVGDLSFTCLKCQGDPNKT